MSLKPTPLTRAELDLFPLPPVVQASKDERGKLLIIAGSRNTPGAAAIAATAAMRAGCGKVSIATSAIKTALDRAATVDAVVAGPGMRRGKVCAQLAEALLDLGLARLVLDAAVLYALPAVDRGEQALSPVLLPHNREMAALLGCDPSDVDKDPLDCGRQCAERYGAITLVKGPQSHIVTPDGKAWKYQSRGPGLGISGSGDALAGILGGLLARRAEPIAALLWAVWLHGEAGAALSRKVGKVGFLAREISAEVPALLPA